MEITVEFHRGKSAAVVSNAQMIAASASICTLTLVSRLNVDLLVTAFPFDAVLIINLLFLLDEYPIKNDRHITHLLQCHSERSEESLRLS